MMKINILFLFCIYLLLAGCQKRKYPDDVQLEKETIYFKGTFDGQPVDLKIGTDGYYCYSSYQQGSDSVYVFNGELRKYNCSPCPLSLRLEMSDYCQRIPNASIPVDSVFMAGTRKILPGLPRALSFRFGAISSKEVVSYDWQTSSGVSSPDSVITCDFAQPGVQTVSLTLRTKNNCEGTVINQVFIGGTSGFFGCSIATATLQNKTSQFNALVTGGKAPFRYSWNFGDGGTSSLSSTQYTYKWAGSYPVKLTVTDAENHVCESNYVHVAGNDQSSCTTNISVLHTGSKKVSLNGIKIQWTDQTNVVLRSDSVTQPVGSYFEILNSQSYAPNENGQSGQLLTLRFNVLVAKGNRNVWLRSDNATMVVAYK